MHLIILHGSEEIHLRKSEIKSIKELRESLKKKVKDSNFNLTVNGKKLDDDSSLLNIKSCISVEYSKRYCEFPVCKLKKCKVSDECRFCHFAFCAMHKMPEEHYCRDLNRCKEEANLKNATELEKGRIDRNKI